MKECPKCNEVKSFDEFYKDKRNEDGVRVYCKDCTKQNTRKRYHKDKEKHKQKVLNYYHKNKKEISEKKKKYYRENKELFRERRKKNYARSRDNELKQMKEWKANNREKIKEYNKEYKSTKEFREYRNEYQRDQYANNELYKLRKTISTFCWRVTDAVKQQKELQSLEYLGCSLDEFKLHIESLWLEGMTWENHGVDGWHIDHKIPLDWFVKNSDDPWEANYFTNLQPLWAADNLSKGASI